MCPTSKQARSSGRGWVRRRYRRRFHPHEAEAIQAWPVSRVLNRVGMRDDAELIE